MTTLSKYTTNVFIWSTHEGDTTVTKEMRYTKEEMSYMKVEPLPCLLVEDSSSKGHVHHILGFTFHDLYGQKDIKSTFTRNKWLIVLTSHGGVMTILVESVRKAEGHTRLSGTHVFPPFTFVYFVKTYSSFTPS
jgi:hypothetical protein